MECRDRAHFYGVAAKRGGNQCAIALDEAILAVEDRAEALLALDEALSGLETLDPRLGQVVECREAKGWLYHPLSA